MINEFIAICELMNTSKNIAIPWLKRGTVVFVVASCVFIFNISTVAAVTSSSSASAASASASSGTGSVASSSVTAVATTATANASAAASASSASSGSSSSSSTSVAVSCAASASSVATGSAVAYSANINGGSGTYSYSWSGTDGLSGSSRTISRAYSTAGTKIATVTVSSASSSATATCQTSVNPPPPPPPPHPVTLNGSCIANTSNAEVGDTVSWSATGVTGGTGDYTYSWSGTDGLSGTGSSVSKTYNSAGSKTATLHITSGSQSVTRNCNTFIRNPIPQPLVVSCSASAESVSVGSSVVFSANATGGNGHYSYSWSGTDGLSGTGSSVSKTYNSAGSKNARVCVVSDGNCVSAYCSVEVNRLPPPPPPPHRDNLSGSCEADTSNAEIGDTVYWSATGVTGGDGYYSYSWSGDEGLYGNGQNVSQSYSRSGTKNATVTIRSDGQSITRNCSTSVRRAYIPPYNPPYNPPQYNNLNASCFANQTSAYVGDAVNWSATGVTGGDGYYSYSWSGTDGFYGNNYSAYQTYNNAGTKFAYLTVYSNGQSITRTCSLYVNDRYSPVVTYTTPQPPYYPPYNGVSLSQVPYTGLESNVKVILFTLALIAWSAMVTYAVIIRKRANLSLAASGLTSSAVSASDEVQQSARHEILMGYDNMLSNLESFARSQNVIISGDALAAIVDMAGNNQNKAEVLLSSLANQHATNQDWTTLDLSKVQGVIG